MVAREAELLATIAVAHITCGTAQLPKNEPATFATSPDTWRSVALRSLQAPPEVVATTAEVLTLQENALLLEVLVALLAQLETATFATNQDTLLACAQ